MNTRSPAALASLLAALLVLPCCGDGPKGKPLSQDDGGAMKTIVKKDPAAGAGGDAEGDGTSGTKPVDATPVSQEEARRRAVVQQLTKQLAAAQDSDDRAEVLSLISDLGASARSMRPQVVSALEDEEPMCRGFAISALAAIDPKGCRPQLQKALKDDEGEVRAKAAEAWGTVGIVDLMPLLDHANDEIDEKVQHAIMMVVEKNGQDFLVDKVVAIMGALDATAAKAGIRFLAAHKDKGKKHAAKVAEVLTRYDPALRTLAAETLETFGVKSPAVIEGLIGALADDDKPVRYAAAKALFGLTGHRTSYKSSQEGAEREAGIKAWRDWLNANKDSLGS